MLILGIETSCDETGVALFDTACGLIERRCGAGGAARGMHAASRPARACPAFAGGAARRIRRRGARTRLARPHPPPAAAGARGDGTRRARAWTICPRSPTPRGRGSPARCSSAPASRRASPSASAFRRSAFTISRATCSRLCSPRTRRAFPFVALLVSGGHTQLMRVSGIGEYALLGETQDDAAGEAFDKTAKLLGLPYPGGPALARLAEGGRAGRFRLPRPMIASGDLDFSFSGLKTAVATMCAQHALDEPHARRHRARVRGSRGGRAGREMRCGDGANRTRAAGRRRRRGRQPAAARRARRGPRAGRVSTFTIRHWNSAPTTAR